jgi:uncharacterized protein (UPF0303 family)
MSKNKEIMKELIRQEETLQFTEFTNETALQLGMILVNNAKKNRYPIAIDITRNGQKLFYYAFEGTSVDNEYWIAGKARAVNRFGRSSFYVGLYHQERGLKIDPGWPISDAEYAPYSGSFPIIIKNVGPVGTITVSGLIDSAEADHNFVVEAVQEYLSK